MVVSLGTHKDYEYTTISGDKAMMLKFKALFMVALGLVNVYEFLHVQLDLDVLSKMVRLKTEPHSFWIVLAFSHQDFQWGTR